MSLTPFLPAVTAAPAIQHLEARQQVALQSIWTPVTVGPTITYTPFQCNAGQTLSASSPYWRCCATSTTCDFATSCSSGSYFFPGFTGAGTCTGVGSACGTQFLYNTLGAADRYTRLVCANDIEQETFYIQSPVFTISSSSTSSSSTSSSSTSSASSSTGTAVAAGSRGKKSKTNLGAIVGGVIGGVVLLALVAIGMFLLLWRKKKNKAEHSPVTPTSAPMQQTAEQNHSHMNYAQPPAGYMVAGGAYGQHGENKYGPPGSHQSYGSPPPVYPPSQHDPRNSHGFYGPGQYDPYATGGMAAAGTQTQHNPSRNSVGRPLSMNPVNQGPQYAHPAQSYQSYRPDQAGTPVGGYPTPHSASTPVGGYPAPHSASTPINNNSPIGRV